MILALLSAETWVTFGQDDVAFHRAGGFQFYHKSLLFDARCTFDQRMGTLRPGILQGKACCCGRHVPQVRRT